MLLPVALWFADAAGPTLADVQALPPAAAGELMLARQPHGPILVVRQLPKTSPQPPGLVELQLDEAPATTPAGCVLRRWMVAFQRVGEKPAAQTGSYPVTNVALARAGRCDGVTYAHVNPRIDPARALASLATIERLARGGRRGVQVSCRSEVKSALCDDRSTLLRRVVARGASLVLGDATVLYGERPLTPIKVTVGGSPVRTVTVREFVPPPF